MGSDGELLLVGVMWETCAPTSVVRIVEAAMGWTGKTNGGVMRMGEGEGWVELAEDGVHGYVCYCTLTGVETFRPWRTSLQATKWSTYHSRYHPLFRLSFANIKDQLFKAHLCSVNKWDRGISHCEFTYDIVVDSCCLPSRRRTASVFTSYSQTLFHAVLCSVDVLTPVISTRREHGVVLLSTQLWVHLKFLILFWDRASLRLVATLCHVVPCTNSTTAKVGVLSAS